MKDRKTYKILTYCSFILPLNRFYSGESGLFIRSITMNLFMIGWIMDMFYMDKRFDEAMAKRGFVNTRIRNKQDKH